MLKYGKDITMTTFAERMELLLFENRMNRSQLARRLGVAVSTVHRWFVRGSVPSLETLSQIADIFNVDIKWLIGEQEERKTTPDRKETEVVEEETIKEDELDEELVRLIRGLTPAQQQRVRDFLAGLRG